TPATAASCGRCSARAGRQLSWERAMPVKATLAKCQAMVRGHGPLLQRLVGRWACPGWGAVTSPASLSTNHQAALLFVGTGHAREGNPAEVQAMVRGHGPLLPQPPGCLACSA